MHILSRRSSRCLQLTKFYPPIEGGIETTVRDIAEGLATRDWSVEILCAHTERRTVEESGPIPVTRVSSWGEVAKTSMTPALILWLLRRQRRNDVIHIHLPNPMANLALLLTRPRAKIVLHWHSDIVKQQRLLKLYAPLQEWLLKRADAILVTSPPYAESSPWLRAYADKVHVVPSCIRDPDDCLNKNARERARNLVRQAYPGKRIVFALGRMTYYKGFDVLVEAAQHLDEDVVVLLGGKGELLEDLKVLAQRLGVAHKVHFLGRVSDEDLPGYYEAADVFCLPSLMRSEAFGLVMVEAMSYRRPVVATAIPGSGVTWVNVHGETGLNAEPGNAKDLAATLKQVLDNPAMAQAMGEAGRRRFEQNFTIDKMIDAVTGAFRHIGVGQSR